ncbi:M23 family metallopeptidase [Kamptonema formosum]|uniref:M23 family metallopeptidase n=1 Tax=Kamptonema formosum TaxID=331992 RepID=UPI00034CE3F6|nr:M23 family metallopeptidase [Oscillatoria sp. PCC 10802]
MNTKRLTSAIAAASLLTLGGLGVSLQKAGIKPMPAVAQTASCDASIRTEYFSRRVGSSNGINLRSDRRLDARTSQNVAYNQMVEFDGWAYGQSVNDLWTGKPDALWYKLKNQNLWVPSAYMIGYPPSNPPIQPNCSNGSSNGSGQINLPFRSGQTWYVCQGYQGPISHSNTYSFDLTVAREDIGSTGCWAANGNVNKSAGQPVFAPAAGTVSYVNSDMVCLTLDSGRSLLIGHMNRTVGNGARVNQDTQLGTVSGANQATNGGYAHIHIEARNGAGCPLPVPQRSVPFTAAQKFQFNGVGDLPDLPGRPDYQGRALTRR